MHMSESLEFGYGSSVGNDSVFGAPKSWAKAKEGGGVDAAYRGYRRHRGFFDVIWQINVPKPAQPNKPESARRVRLQVESPTYDNDPSLNNLKREVIRALLDSNLRRLVREKGYSCDEARVRTSDAQIRNSKTTTLFSVMLDRTQSKATPEENIKAVHEALRQPVDAVLQRFVSRLDQ